MRISLAIALVLAVAGSARADEVDDLVAQGDALAKQSDYSKAIEVFKQADAQRPRAKHACLIGLAYTRRELWPQAELFFALCHARATADDPLPTWIDKAEKLLADKLAETGAAPVTITVTPEQAKPSVVVSSFASDESFPPRTIHLARGKHLLEISAPGYATVTREVVVASADAQTVAVELVTTEVAARAKQPIVLRERPRSNVPLVIGAGGLALGLGGTALDWFVVKPYYDKLANAPTHKVYDRYATDYKVSRDATVAAYALGVAAVATAVVLRFTVYDHGGDLMQVSASVGDGGMIHLSWSR
jgi:hypothetical protein